MPIASRPVRKVFAAAPLLGLLLPLGVARAQPWPIDEDPAETLRRSDANCDGVLSFDEALSARLFTDDPPGQEAFGVADRDGDGQVTARELRAHYRWIRRTALVAVATAPEAKRAPIVAAQAPAGEIVIAPAEGAELVLAPADGGGELPLTPAGGEAAPAGAGEGAAARDAGSSAVASRTPGSPPEAEPKPKPEP